MTTLIAIRIMAMKKQYNYCALVATTIVDVSAFAAILGVAWLLN